MPKFVNSALEVAASGLEVAFTYWIGGAFVGPIFKLCWPLVLLAFEKMKPLFNSEDKKEDKS